MDKNRRFLKLASFRNNYLVFDFFQFCARVKKEKNNGKIRISAPVAQRIERSRPKGEVGGSIPPRGTFLWFKGDRKKIGIFFSTDLVENN